MILRWIVISISSNASLEYDNGDTGGLTVKMMDMIAWSLGGHLFSIK